MHSLLALVSLLPLSLAVHLQVAVPVTPATLPPSTIATLNALSNSYSAHLTTTNSFSFRNVSTGSYLFDIVSSTHSFAPLRIDVSEDTIEAWGTFRGNEWDNKGEVVPIRQSKGIFVLESKSGKEKEFFLPRSGYSPLSILKNPMILMAGAMMLMVFGMPYLMENMDPEMKAEFEERQKGGSLSGSVGNTLLGGGNGGFDAASWLAGATSKPEEKASGHVPEKGVSR